jgi:hypothetical protein
MVSFFNKYLAGRHVSTYGGVLDKFISFLRTVPEKARMKNGFAERIPDKY